MNSVTDYHVIYSVSRCSLLTSLGLPETLLWNQILNAECNVVFRSNNQSEMSNYIFIIREYAKNIIFRRLPNQWLFKYLF